MKYLELPLRFIFAVLQHLWAFVAGSFVAVAGYIYQYVLHKEMPVNILFLALGVYLFIGCFLTWRTERLQALDLNKKIKPKIKLSFRNDDPGCVLPKTIITTQNTFTGEIINQRPATYYRIKVEVDSISVVRECIGRLTEVIRDDEILFSGNNLIQTFAPAERVNSDVQDITDKIPEYLDLLAIGEHDNSVKIITKGNAKPSNISWDTMFDKEGKYRFHVVVASRASDCKSSEIDIYMDWKGKLDSVKFQAVTS